MDNSNDSNRRKKINRAIFYQETIFLSHRRPERFVYVQNEVIFISLVPVFKNKFVRIRNVLSRPQSFPVF